MSSLLKIYDPLQPTTPYQHPYDVVPPQIRTHSVRKFEVLDVNTIPYTLLIIGALGIGLLAFKEQDAVDKMNLYFASSCFGLAGVGGLFYSYFFQEKNQTKDQLIKESFKV
ncbi:MAG: hypothetical protein JHC93_00495 [Parachlamydiales bacterium]|nr:hypothetical protein [Parachlamydiales bacterium]